MEDIKTFFTLMLAFLPIVIVIIVALLVQDKRYNSGTRPEDQLIRKTRILAVNDVEVVTHNGLVPRMIVGQIVGGTVGGFLGGLSSVKVRYDNVFTFLVYYNDGRQNVEKVKQSSGRFTFLVSKLEDEERQTPISEPQADALQIPPTPPVHPNPLPPNAKAKTVQVPVGDYIVCPFL